MPNNTRLEMYLVRAIRENYKEQKKTLQAMLYDTQVRFEEWQQQPDPKTTATDFEARLTELKVSLLGLETTHKEAVALIQHTFSPNQIANNLVSVELKQP